MIIEKFTKLDKRKRISAAVLTVLVAAYICHFVITRDSVVKLQTANAKHAGIEAEYASTELQQAELSSLQKQFEEKQMRLREYQQQFFSNSEAVQFFENINSMALAYNLKPISRVISEPEKLSDGKADHDKSKSEQQSLNSARDGELACPEQVERVEPFLKTQSAKLIISGNYFNIVDFLDELANQPQKVCITNLNIALPAGERVNPRVSFSISVPIDTFSTTLHETKILARNEAANITITPNSSIDRQIPAHPLTAPRNPMQFALAKAAENETGKVIVKGILYVKDNPSTLIGNKIVREGDEVSGTTIVKINENSVEFEMNGIKWEQKVQR